MSAIDRAESSSEGGRGFRIGPGLLITAAFIGPGTVVTASKAGAERGLGLLWAIVFACFGTIVLQSLAARLGIIGRKGLGESIRDTLAQSPLLKPAIALVISAIGIGNTAYQTGNLTGAAIGVHACVGGSPETWLAIIVICTCVILLVGRYRVLHAVLVGLVAILSVSFLCTAALSLPSVSGNAWATAIPRLSSQDLTLTLALIGTTIVPYNLFLHASSAAETWKNRPISESVIQSDWDTTGSVCLGGLITASILVTASTAFFDTQAQLKSVDDISLQLKPTLGEASAIAFAIGLFAAGLTSSITAPMATAYAVCGCLGWSVDPSSTRFRSIAIGVVAIGGSVALGFGKSPSATIVFAQLTNGLLLPIVALFLLVATSPRRDSRTTSLDRLRVHSARLVVVAVALLGLWRIAVLFH
ncbi:Nramp family divalent metal transporter [Crateriforma spongiae]|uniref:Nramp family divalent metal transporter n=1 Tax=Crateriforma spongiae TaxID=2724528 RepID=UPI0028F3E951|nr:Nramp family divalent metal transporter [Crateriforma spongiae]